MYHENRNNFSKICTQTAKVPYQPSQRKTGSMEEMLIQYLYGCSTYCFFGFVIRASFLHQVPLANKSTVMDKTKPVSVIKKSNLLSQSPSPPVISPVNNISIGYSRKVFPEKDNYVMPDLSSVSSPVVTEKTEPVTSLRSRFEQRAESESPMPRPKRPTNPRGISEIMVETIEAPRQLREYGSPRQSLPSRITVGYDVVGNGTDSNANPRPPAGTRARTTGYKPSMSREDSAPGSILSSPRPSIEKQTNGPMQTSISDVSVIQGCIYCKSYFMPLGSMF